MAKEIENYVKLQIPAGEANPAPPVGPALGQHGLNIQDFCKSFNAKTEKLEKGIKVPVVITVYNDKSFDFVVKTAPASILIKKAANVEKGSGRPKSVRTEANIEEVYKLILSQENASGSHSTPREISRTHVDIKRCKF